jgi:hypothetical protein
MNSGIVLNKLVFVKMIGSEIHGVVVTNAHKDVINVLMPLSVMSVNLVLI